MKMRYWFKANRNGLGWRPAHIYGWLVLLVYISLMLYGLFNAHKPGASWITAFYVFLPLGLLYTGLLIVITYLMGESITWGDKGSEQHKIP